MTQNEMLRQNQRVQKLIDENKEMSYALENLGAENACLRQLSKVPDNFGEQLKLYKQKQKDNAVFYKHNNDVLMKDIENLEKEKTMLQYELRKWRMTKPEAFNLLDGLDEDQKQAVHSWIMNLKDGKQEIPLTEKSETLKAEILRLQDKIAIYEEVLDKGRENSHGHSELNGDQLQTILAAIRDQKVDIHNMFGSLKNNTVVHDFEDVHNESKHKQPSRQPVGNSYSMMPDRSAIQQTITNINRPPRPLPGVFGDWTEVTEGMSYKFSSKLPLKTYDEELSNMDIDKAKYYIAALQLHNMESIELLHQRENEFEALNNEMQEIRSALRHALLVEDELFSRHHFELTNFEGKVGDLKNENYELKTECIQTAKRCEVFEASFAAIQSKNQVSIEGKLAEMTKTAALAETNIVKLSRKYDALETEYNQVTLSRQVGDKDKYEREYQMTEKLNALLSWKNDATEKIKILLERLNTSVPQEDHNSLKAEFELERQKYASLKAAENIMREQNIKLQGVERESQEKSDQFLKLEDEIAAFEAEYAVLHMRLCTLDKMYERHTVVFKNIANILKQKNISPLQYFQAVDTNRDGLLNLEEFVRAMESMGVNFSKGELEHFYSFLDIDNSGSVSYEEFCRKLKRYGVVLRTAQEEFVNKMWNSIMKANMTLEQAYKAFDLRGQNDLTYADMIQAFRQLDIEIDAKTSAEFFKLADVSGNGKISCAEFVHVFSRFNKREKAALTAEKMTNWKIDLMAQLDHLCREKNVTIEQVFNDIDDDGDSRVTFAEFRRLFLNMKLNIEQKSLQQLFNEIDGNRSGVITLTEFMAYVNNAKRESEKVKRILAFEKSLNSRNQGSESNLADGDSYGYSDPTTKYQLKIAQLESKQATNHRQQEALITKLNNLEDERETNQVNIKSMEDTLLNTQQQLITEKERCASLERKCQSSMTKEQAALTRATNENLRLENVQLKSALETFRNLHDAAVREAKSLSLAAGKNNDEIIHLRKEIRELQSVSDENALIGKLYNQILTEKWTEANINRKYDQLLDDLRKSRIAASNLEVNLKKKEAELVDMQSAAFEKVNHLERQLFEARMSILPTVTLAKLEELNLSLKRIGNQKLELEIINKQLRNDSYENQIRLDNYILREKNLLDLEETLKTRYPDELSMKIVEISEKLSTYKLESLKAQREVTLVREREEYYMRVNKAQTDQILALEELVAKNDEKFVQRETFWRDRHQDQIKLVSKMTHQDINKDSGLDISPAHIHQRMRDGVSSLSKEERDVMFTPTPNMRSAVNLMSHSALDMDNQILHDKIRFMEQDANLKDITIQKLERQLEHKQVGVNYRTDNVETLVISDLEAKTREIAQAAQHTVQTLQMMVEEKTQLLNDKEKKVDMLRNDLTEKAKLLSKLELENENLRRQVSTGERNRMNVEEITAIRTIEKLAKMDAKEIERMVVTYEQKLQILAEELSESEKINKDLMRKLRASRGEKAISDNTKTTESKTQDLDRLNKELADMKDLYKKKASDVKRLNAVLTSYAKDLEDMKGEVTKTQIQESQKVTVARNEHGHYEEKIGVLTSKFKSLQDDYSKDRKQIQDLKANEIRYRQQISDLNEQLNKMSALNTQLKDQNSKLGAKRLTTNAPVSQTLPTVGGSRRPSSGVKPTNIASNGVEAPSLIHFRETLNEITTEELEQLRNERDRLRKEVEILRTQKGMDLSKELAEVEQKELKELRDQNKRIELEVQLLRQVLATGAVKERPITAVQSRTRVSGTQSMPMSDPLQDAMLEATQKQVLALNGENTKLNAEIEDLRLKVVSAANTDEFIDEDGFLYDNSSTGFTSKDVFIGVIRKYVNTIGNGLNLFSVLKKADPTSIGSAPLDIIFQELAKAGMRFGDRDKRLTIPDFIPKSPSGQVDYKELYYQVKGNVADGSTMTSGLQPSSKLPLTDKHSTLTHQKSINMHTAVLDKNVDLLKRKLLEKEREVADLTKQLKSWKQTALGYENELKDKNSSARNTSMSMNATLQAKLGKEGDKLKQIQDLENQVRILKSDIRYEVDKREQIIKEIQEDVTRRTYEMSIAQSECQNLRSQLDRVLKSRLQKDQLWDEKEKEKDVLVSSLMERLEKSRKAEDDVRTKLRAIERENIDLKHTKEGIDTKLENMNREIRELKDKRGIE